MSDEATGKPGRTWLHVATWLGFASLLYVLSIGPSIVLRERGVVTDATVKTLYGPLLWMMGNTGGGDWSTGYIRAWLKMTGTLDPNDIP